MGMFFLGAGSVIVLIVLVFLTAKRQDPAITQADIDRAKAAITPDLQYELELMLGDGRKIDAIRRLREVTGVGLYAAKQAVDGLSPRH